MTPSDRTHDVEERLVSSARLTTRCLLCGPDKGEPVLLLHGNLSGAVVWEETLVALGDIYRVAACDLRGYGGAERNALIDATRGVADWVDDVMALADALEWNTFHVVGHSLSGVVLWGAIARYGERLRTATFVAPGPPCGFGGTRDVMGSLNFDDGAGSGAGLVHPTLVRLLAEGRREEVDPMFSPRAAMNRLFWKPPFRPVREEAILTAMLDVHLGGRQFPGDFRPSPHWPGFRPGEFGPINALAPLYNQWVLAELLESQGGPPLLWVGGTDDAIICDASPSDVGTQGKLGYRADWPGEDVFPPQPLHTQVVFALDAYESRGGSVTRRLIPGAGHTPFLERPTLFLRGLRQHLRQGET
ncbi:MAG: alpha/beta hydrolase [Planctomycetales bacterium]|nr:alpha/beta hydrolase [Planctomycetales bacterium]